jgi:hypothetical protein
MFFKDFLVAVHVSLGWSARVWVIPGWFASLRNLQESTSFLNAVPIIQKAPHAELAAQVRLLMDVDGFPRCLLAACCRHQEISPTLSTLNVRTDHMLN